MKGTRVGLLERMVKHERSVLAALMGGFFVVITGLCFSKYGRLGYDAIDLAYFNQVFWNTVRGDWFLQSIHPHLSLGDHAELAIPFLMPLYALWQDPRMLLAMQAAALAATAWPVWRLAKLRAASVTDGMAWLPLLMAAAWLGNPLLHNIAFFEFHILAFAVFPLLMALVAYREEGWRRFLAWSAAALLVREDVALVVMMVGALAWMERRPWKWRLVPLGAGLACFAAMLALVSRFSPSHGYKFSVYYGWLGSSLPEMAVNALANPGRIALHLLTLPNLEMLIGLLMPFAFLPLVRPRALVLLLGPLAQMALGKAGGGTIVLETHYTALFLPALVLSAIDAAAVAPDLLQRAIKQLSRTESRIFTAGIVLLCSAYSAAFLGPIPGSVAAAWRGTGAARAAEARALIAALSPDASVAAPYRLLPALSSRSGLYSMHYLYLGQLQFAIGPYAVPADMEYLVLDEEDLIAYEAQFPETGWTAPYHHDGLERLRRITGEQVKRVGRYTLFRRSEDGALGGGNASDADGATRTDGVFREGDQLIARRQWPVGTPTQGTLVEFALVAPDGTALTSARQRLESLTTTLLPDGSIITEHRLPIPSETPMESVPVLRLMRASPHLRLSPERGTFLEYDDGEVLQEYTYSWP